MGIDEGNLQVKDVDVILQKLSNNNYSSTVRYILTSSEYGVHNSHYILHL